MSKLDLVQERPAEVIAGHGLKAEPELLPGLADPPTERTRRSGVVRRGTPRPPLGKHNLQSSNHDLTT